MNCIGGVNVTGILAVNNRNIIAELDSLRNDMTNITNGLRNDTNGLRNDVNALRNEVNVLKQPSTCRNIATKPYSGKDRGLEYLDGHNVVCNENESISAFKVTRPNSHDISYNYKCCKIK